MKGRGGVFYTNPTHSTLNRVCSSVLLSFLRIVQGFVGKHRALREALHFAPPPPPQSPKLEKSFNVQNH